MFSGRQKRFAQEAALGALLHFIALTLLAGGLFLLAHVPPRAAAMDSLILIFQWVYEVLYFPLASLRWLWPGEASPWWLNGAVRLLGHTLVGAALAGGYRLWRGTPSE